MKGSGRMRRSFKPRTHQYLTVTYVNTSCIDICQSARQVIGDVEGVQVRIRIHFAHNHTCADGNDVQAVIMDEVLLVGAALQCAACIFCRTRNGSAPIVQFGKRGR